MTVLLVIVVFLSVIRYSALFNTGPVGSCCTKLWWLFNEKGRCYEHFGLEDQTKQCWSALFPCPCCSSRFYVSDSLIFILLCIVSAFASNLMASFPHVESSVWADLFKILKLYHSFLHICSLPSQNQVPFLYSTLQDWPFLFCLWDIYEVWILNKMLENTPPHPLTQA